MTTNVRPKDQNMKKSVLVSLKFTMWDSNVQDSAASEEMAAQKKVKNKKMCRVRKSLVPGNTALADIKEIHNNARKFLYDNTFPWKFKGPQILVIDNYDSVMTKLREFEAQFNIAVPEFLSQMKDIEEEAKEQLGDLFNQNDYPSVESLKSKFHFSISVDALPVASDLLALGLSESEIEKIEQANTDSLVSVLENANNSLWEKLQERVTAFYENTVNPKSKTRKTTLDALIEVAELFPKINITNDDRLNSICDNILFLLVTETKESLDLNPVKKEKIATKMKEIKELIEVIRLDSIGISVSEVGDDASSDEEVLVA